MKQLMQTVYCLQNLGRFPFSRKLRKLWQEIKWNGPFRFGPTGIFVTASEGDLYSPIQSFRLDQNVRFYLTIFCFQQVNN